MTKMDSSKEFATKHSQLQIELAELLGYAPDKGYPTWHKIEETAPVQVMYRLEEYFHRASQELVWEARNNIGEYLVANASSRIGHGVDPDAAYCHAAHDTIRYIGRLANLTKREGA